MARDPDIEQFRQMFQDPRVWVGCGIIKKLDLVSDRSVWRALVRILPDDYEVVARMSWQAVGPKAGIFGPASVDDLVVVVMPEGSEDNAIVVARLSSKADQIPSPAADGHLVLKALEGKKIMLGKAGDQESDEPMVLGTVLKTLLSDILSELKTVMTALASHTHDYTGLMTGAPGTTGAPDNASTYTSAGSTFDSKKSSPVDDDTINSDVIFGEKGS